MATAMIRLHDCEPISTDFKGDGGKTEARDTFLTMLIGIIPSGWRLNAGNQVNGLMGRFTVLYADRTEHDILTPPREFPEERSALLSRFRQLLQVRGEMRLDPRSEPIWLTIQQDNRRRLRANPSEQIASNLTRMPHTVLRVAMLYQLAIDGKLAITPTALELASQYVEFCHRCYCRFFGRMRDDRGARLADRIVRHLHRSGGRLPHSPLFNRVSTHGECDATDFRDALEVLRARGEVRFEESAAYFPDVVLATGPGQVAPHSTQHSGNGDEPLTVRQDGERTTVPPAANPTAADQTYDDRALPGKGPTEAASPASAEAVVPVQPDVTIANPSPSPQTVEAATAPSISAHKSNPSGEGVAARASAVVTPPPPAMDSATAQTLHRALHSFSDALERWQMLRANGASDRELQHEIAYEFSPQGAGPGYKCKGGQHPCLTLATGFVLKGTALLHAVRGLLGIPLTPTALDLFCGAGGMSCGFRDGYRIVAANDDWSPAIRLARSSFQVVYALNKSPPTMPTV